MVFLMSALRIVKVCPTEYEAFYHADILKLNEYFVHDVALNSFDTFSDRELALILANHTFNPDVVAKWNREVRVGAVLNVCNNMELDETPIPTLHRTLKRKPLAPQIAILSAAQREKQMGPVNTQPVTQRATGARTSAKRPKAGTTTARVWDKCDQLFSEGKSIPSNELRDELITWGDAEGINKSTVRTQYGHWKRDKLCVCSYCARA